MSPECDTASLLEGGVVGLVSYNLPRMHPWRERLSRWFTPLARHTPLSPNVITVVALLVNLAAAACLSMGGRRPLLFLAAIPLIAMGGLADALDGIVARAQGRSSRFGDFLDHCSDRLSDTMLAAGWLYGNKIREPLLIAVIVAIMMTGYVGTQIEATYRERDYDSVGRGEFVLAMVIAPIASFILHHNRWQTLRLGTFTIAETLAIALLLMACFAIVQRLLQAWRLEKP